jgi:hypothetical protein
LQSRVNSEMAAALFLFAERMASLAIRNDDPGLVVNGLIALTLDDGTQDNRDALVPLCLLCDASRRLKMFDPKGIKAILGRATPKRSERFSHNIDTDFDGTTPETIGFVPTGEGATFHYSWPRKYSY